MRVRPREGFEYENAMGFREYSFVSAEFARSWASARRQVQADGERNHCDGFKEVNAVTFRTATLDDCARLAGLNHQLIRDEGHRNPMTVPQLEERMRGWLADEYRAVIYEDGGEVVAYALFREDESEIYLRQLFVVRHRRGQGIGHRAVQILRSQIWPKDKRLTVEVLTANKRAVKFWRSVGYSDYALRLEIMPPAL